MPPFELGVAMAYVYGLKDPRDGEIRYIGCTIQTVKARLSEIVSKARKGWRPSNPCTIWVKELVAQGLRPEPFLVEQVEDDKRHEAETKWIAHYRGICNLTNVAPGGKTGCLGLVLRNWVEYVKEGELCV